MGPITLESFGPEMARLAAQLRGDAALQAPMKAAEQMVLADVKSNFDGSHDPDGRAWAPLAHPRPAGGAKPLQDRGLLAASISARSSRGGELIVGTTRPGANLHQHGGVVRPVRAKFLAIPLTAAASRAGGPRRFPGELHAVVASARGQGVLVDDKGTAQFALARQVRVRARPFLGFGPKLIARLEKLFADWLVRLAAGGK